MSEETEDSDADETYRLTVESEEQQGRLDKVMAAFCEDLSRSRIQALIEQGQAMVNGAVCLSVSKKLGPGDVVEIFVPPPVDALPGPEDIPLDIVYEDSGLLVLNKPAGLVVHPGAGNREGTMVNALLHHCGASLSGIGGVLRPGIVHRLDKDTSGLMVVAKNDKAHRGLALQLEDRTLSRLYKALVFKVPFPARGAVDQPLGRHPSNRLKMAVRNKGGKAAKTRYRVEKKFGAACALVECELESGRTHQIRVHMNFINHPLIGDPLYGPQKNALASMLKKEGYAEDIVAGILDFPRQSLHAESISFIHPLTGESMAFTAPPPADMAGLLKLLEAI